MELTAENTALLVVDMQNGFCHDDGSVNQIGLPAARLQTAIEPCRQLIAAARGANIPIIYTRYVYRPDYTDGGVMVHELIPDLKNGHCLAAGTWDIEVLDELAPGDDDFIIDKNRPSAFFSAEMEPMLKRLGISDLVVCGVTTNCCVETTVRDASQRDYRTFVVEDAVAEYEDDRNDVALKSMGMLFAGLVTVDDVLDAWRPAA
jgi:ureidoacrylate peracid hydrolase